MPKLSKKFVSLFFRTGCEKQLKLYLYKDAERKDLKMPPREQRRSGFTALGQAGNKWQNEKTTELAGIFGASNVIQNATSSEKETPASIPLLEHIESLKPYQFLVEPEYETTDTLKRQFCIHDLSDEFGNAVHLAELRPDILQAVPSEAGIFSQVVSSDGTLHDVQAGDNRLQLRVIDIKLSSEPGAHYFAEVTLYSLALAALLEEHGLDDRFSVAAHAAVWPGSYADSELRKAKREWDKRAYTPTLPELVRKMNKDLEEALFEVFVPRLRSFFAQEFPKVLSTPWDALPYHVNYRCAGCEFLGYPGWRDEDGNPTNDEKHCWPTAERKSLLCRVFGLSESMAQVLEQERNGLTVEGLAALNPSHQIFAEHKGLQARRTVLPQRAESLVTGESGTLDFSGSSASMPKWPDLRVYIFLEYDLSTAITSVLTLNAEWTEPAPFGTPFEQKERKSWPEFKKDQPFTNADPYTFVIPDQNILSERREFLRFLEKLKEIMDQVRKLDSNLVDLKTTYQIFLWDSAQLKHLTRLVGRHLGAIIHDKNLKDIAWLFPPAELLQHPEDATRKSPITLVADVVRGHVKVPTPHHYTLLQVGEHYANKQWAANAHPLYYDPLSDLVPMERIHEYWSKGKDWQQKEEHLRGTVKRKRAVLQSVSTQLGHDLKGKLSKHSAPPISFDYAKQRLKGAPVHSQLWYQFIRLNAAVDELETLLTRALPSFEREAKYKAARLRGRLEGPKRANALRLINKACGKSFSENDDLLVYALRDDSRYVNFKEGHFGLVLSPDTLDGASLPDQHILSFLKDMGVETQLPGYIAGKLKRKEFVSVVDSGFLSVELKAIDRDNGLVALRPKSEVFSQIEATGKLNLRTNVVLDETSIDTLTSRIKLTLEKIGFPEAANADERVYRALGETKTTKKRYSPTTPAVDILWKAGETAKQVTARDTNWLKSKLEPFTILDDSQWHAFEHSLGHRLSLIWGPPGTGKSTTLRAICSGAVLQAHHEKKGLRILVTANNYTAVDNVLLKLKDNMPQELKEACSVFKVQSSHRKVDDGLSELGAQVICVNSANPSDEVQDLRKLLNADEGIIVIGTTPQQVHNLAKAGISSKSREIILREWFDLLIIDEATQMDTPTSILALTKIKPDATCILAGDDLQLPPIHKVEAPLSLEYLVGSVYEFVRHHHEVKPIALERNYRSNRTLVSFVQRAGYPKLESHFSDLHLTLSEPLPTKKPSTWSETLLWDAALLDLLNPDYPATCLVYEDTVSSQMNQFEADLIGSLLKLLENRLAKSRENSDEPMKPYGVKAFWEHGVGVVAPHRAQVSCVVETLLQTNHTHERNAIRSAVDTVERFQGQERDVIIGSFGLGDVDLIRGEEEFLYNLRRFNVMASRAKAKLIVLISKNVLNHLSNDIEVLKDSALLKVFAQSFCGESVGVSIRYPSDNAGMRVGEIRRRQ